MRQPMTPPDYSMATAAAIRRPRTRRVGLGRWSTSIASTTSPNAPATGNGSTSTSNAPAARARSAAPIAHGYLTLSLVAATVLEHRRHSARRGDRPQLRPRQGALHRAGEERRARPQPRQPACGRAADTAGASCSKLQCTLEIEGEAKPALVADILCMSDWTNAHRPLTPDADPYDIRRTQARVGETRWPRNPPWCGVRGPSDLAADAGRARVLCRASSWRAIPAIASARQIS